jgi:hypothetical protein
MERPAAVNARSALASSGKIQMKNRGGHRHLGRDRLLENVR